MLLLKVVGDRGITSPQACYTTAAIAALTGSKPDTKQSKVEAQKMLLVLIFERALFGLKLCFLAKSAAI